VGAAGVGLKRFGPTPAAGAAARRWLTETLMVVGVRLATRAADHQTHGHPAVVRAMRLMEDAPERRWTLAELADDLHLTRGYLVRRFKAATGLPPMAYLSRLREELAAAYSCTPTARSPFGEAVGWPDANYFARRFKAHHGLSASAYRCMFAAARHACARGRRTGPTRTAGAPDQLDRT
jgi:AraC family L-rhamnose operon transcriptional activator RhaR